MCYIYTIVYIPIWVLIEGKHCLPVTCITDESYTAIHPSMASDSGHYTELGGPPTAVTRSESPEEGGKTDYTDQGHYDYLSSMVEVHGASEMKSNSE